MHWASVLRVVGLLLMLFSGTMLPPAIVSVIYDDGGLLPFVVSFGVLLALGLLLWLPVCRSRQDLRTRDGFLIVVLFEPFRRPMHRHSQQASGHLVPLAPPWCVCYLMPDFPVLGLERCLDGGDE